MLNHEQIMNAMLLQLEGGVVIEYEQSVEQARVVFTQHSVNPDYFNLLRASAVLYQTNQKQIEAVQAMIDLARQVGATGIIPPLEEMMLGLTLAKRIALEGVEGMAEGVAVANAQLNEIFKGGSNV